MTWIIGDWEVHSDTSTLQCGSDTRHLTPRAMEVLVYLAEHSAETVSAEMLLEQFWSNPQVGDAAVYKVISEIRHALGEDAKQPRYLQTIPKRGYQLQARLRADDTTESGFIFQGSTKSADAGSRRVLATALGVIVSLALFALFAALAPGNDLVKSVTVASIDGKRIGFIAPSADVSSDMDGIIDTIHRELTMKIGQLPNASVETIEATNPGERTLSERLNLDHVVALKYLETNLIVEIMPGSSNTAHIDRFDVASMKPSGAGAVSNIVDRVMIDLDVLSSTAHLKRMKIWGTRDIHAYRFAYEGALFERLSDNDKLVKAAARYQQAIQSDPTFSNAYIVLAGTYFVLANQATSTAAREAITQSMIMLRHMASQANLDGDVMNSLDMRMAVMSANHMELAVRFRSELVANPESRLALYNYAKLLAGAGFAIEAKQYLDKTIGLLDASKDDAIADGAWTVYATIAGVTDIEESIRWGTKIIDQYPNYPVSLFGLVQNNAFIGNFTEAERHLERLVQTDEEGAWAYAGQLALLTQKGELPVHSEELELALADPRASNMMRGQIYFQLGDIERGIAAWRDMEPAFEHLLWEYRSNIEKKFHPTVADDPRYQALLGEFGLGKQWRAYLHQQTAELTDITGIQISTSVEAPELNLIARFGVDSVSISGDLGADGGF